MPPYDAAPITVEQIPVGAVLALWAAIGAAAAIHVAIGRWIRPWMRAHVAPRLRRA